jgi:fucose permease
VVAESLIAERSGRRTTVWSVAAIYLAFALPTSMLGVMWPEVRGRFGQSLGALGLVTVSYGLGRLSTAMSGREMVERFGIARAFLVSLVALGAACACIAGAVSWPMFLVAVGALGVVSGALDSIGSTFITRRAHVGDAGLLHGFYGLGATIGPLVVAVTSTWRLAVAASVVTAVAAVVLTSVNSEWPQPTPAVSRERLDGSTEIPKIAVTASVLVLGAFVAIEVTTGQWAYTYLTDARDVSSTVAAIGIAGFWGASTVGRLTMAHSAVARLIDRVGLPGLAATGAMMFFGFIAVPNAVSIVPLAFAGLVLSPIVPSLFATTAMRVGTGLAARASGWQLAATNVGAISVPALVGALVDSRGPAIIPVVAISVLVAVGLPLLVMINRFPNRHVVPRSL